MASTSAKQKTVVHWFRKGLRLHDNPALKEACDFVESHSEQYVLRPIFILDPDIRTWMRVGVNRLRFLQQSLVQLDQNLNDINSRLYVIRGKPIETFERIFEEWNVRILTYESDIEPYAKKRDAEVQKLANKYNVTVITEPSHTIYDPEKVLALNNWRPITNYRSFQAVVAKLKAPAPLESPIALTCSEPQPDSLESKDPTCYCVPTLEEMIEDVDSLYPCLYPGGETEALRRLQKYMNNAKWVCEFEKPKTSPNSIRPSTTVLSPYLKFGCLSSRFFLKSIIEVYSRSSGHTKPPTSLLGQLLWREFYYCAAAAEPNFDKMVGNRLCYQIPWESNPEHLEAWTWGRTGYPFIDAIMRQLRQEGWIHHLARHAVACFLTRGDLWISWEEGQKVFEELLLDADWALNAGNWMWLSASCFFYQYFRVYSPIVFGKKTDKPGLYIKKYVPELSGYPWSLIYEPWKATLAQQKVYGAIIGKDYPKPIVIHEEVSKINLGKMAEAYKKNKELAQQTKENEASTSSTSAGTKRKYDELDDC